METDLDLNGHAVLNTPLNKINRFSEFGGFRFNVPRRHGVLINYFNKIHHIEICFPDSNCRGKTFHLIFRRAEVFISPGSLQI